MEYGFKRLSIVDEMTTKIDGETVVCKKMFTSELGRALLLDAHINGPGYVNSPHGMWVTALKTVKTNNTTKTVDTTNITPDDQFKLIKEVLTLREASRMTDPNFRSGYIILCCKDFALEATRNKILKKLGYDSFEKLLATIKPKNASKNFEALTEKSALKSCYDFLSYPNLEPGK